MAEKGASPRPSLVPAIAGQVIDVKFMTMQTSSNGPCHGENPRCWLIISRGPTDGFPIWGTSHHDQPLLYLLQPEQFYSLILIIIPRWIFYLGHIPGLIAINRSLPQNPLLSVADLFRKLFLLSPWPERAPSRSTTLSGNFTHS